MIPVRVTARAKREADRAERWWREHRPGSPELFRSEVERGIETIRSAPSLGVPYEHPRRHGIRRLLLPRIGYHLYYRVEDHRILVLHLWHTRRGTSPLSG